MDSSTTALAEDQSKLEVVRVLLLLQGAILLLAGLGMFLLMAGNPAVAPIAFGPPLLLFYLAARAGQRGRWALRVVRGVQVFFLLNLAISVLLGLSPVVDFSPNLVTLLTNLALPLSVLHLMSRITPRAAQASATVPIIATSRVPSAA